MATDDVKARLAAARQARAEREAKFDEEQQVRQLAILELEERLTKELGRRGEDFEIIDGGPSGPIAVKVGEAVLYKRYSTLVKRDKDTQEDTIAFVRPCIAFPDVTTFDEIIGKRGHLLDKACAALVKLYGGWKDRSQGES